MLDYLDVLVWSDGRLKCRHSADQANVIYQALSKLTGKIRSADMFRACGIDPVAASPKQLARFQRAVCELGWESTHRTFDGKPQRAYVKGTGVRRLVELVIKVDPQTQVTTIEGVPGFVLRSDPQPRTKAWDAIASLAAVLHQTLGNLTGKIRVSDVFLVCGIALFDAAQEQREQLGYAIRELGWERKRRRFDGVLEYAYVKGTESERLVQLVVEYDVHTRSVRIEIDKTGQTSATN